MALSRLHPAFHVLLCLQAALAYVEPPTNVTLHCHNLQNILRWSYDQPSPGLKFKVKILRYNGDPDDHWVDSPHLEADLSFLNDPSNQYLLQLFSVIGKNESAAVPTDGIEFSYLKDSLVEQKCFLDLPAVNVTAQRDATVQFRFTHPWLMYQQKLPSSHNPKRRNKKSHDSQTDKSLPEFKYDVVINNQAPHEFTCVEEVCEELLPVNASQEQHCLTIEGELMKMIVKTQKSFCALPVTVTPNPYIAVFIACGVILAAAAAVICLMLYLKKTRASPSLPSTIKKIKSMTQQQQTLRTENVIPNEVEVEPTSPTPLLLETQMETLLDCDRSENDGRLPIRGVSEDERVCDDSEEVSQPSNEASAYAGGLVLEEDAPSGYEKREKVHVPVDLGPDDSAEGYRGNVV